MTKKTQQGKKSEQSIQTTVHFNMPIEMPSVYATNLIVHSSEFEVVLSFFEAQPPIFDGTEEENLEELKKIGVRADCVARVTIAKDRFEGMVKVMQGFSNDLKTQRKEEK